MSAGTVVIAGAVLAAIILLTIVGVLCLCRLQYYCCKREESEKAEDDQEAEFSTMTRPLALSAPPTPPTPDRHSIEPEYRRCNESDRRSNEPDCRSNEPDRRSNGPEYHRRNEPEFPHSNTPDCHSNGPECHCGNEAEYRHSNTPDPYPPTFLTETNGPSCCTPPPPPPPPPPHCNRAHYCPTCTRPLPFCLQRPTCTWDGRNLCYRSFQQHHVELPLDISTLYRKLQLLTMREMTSHHSVSTDV